MQLTQTIIPKIDTEEKFTLLNWALFCKLLGIEIIKRNAIEAKMICMNVGGSCSHGCKTGRHDNSGEITIKCKAEGGKLKPI